MASPYYYQERPGSGNPPPMYDTSTSTADSYSSGSVRKQHRHKNHNDTEYNNMRLTNDYASNQQRQSATRFPRVRKTMSDSGVSTEYDRYLQQQAPKRGSPASDVGAMSVSEQIRKYNRRHRNADPALEFVHEYKHEQLSYTTGTSPGPSHSKDDDDDDDRVMQVREFYSPDRSSKERRRRSGNTQTQNDDVQYYGDVRSKFRAMHQQSITRPGPVSGDPDESFGSSVDPPGASSIRDLKKQLWNEEEILQVGGPSMGRLDQKLQRHQRPSRSLSPARRIVANDTFDSENTGTASFKSKYVEAAMVARERGQPSATNNHHQHDVVPLTPVILPSTPVNTRRTASRPRTNSGGEETQVSSFSSPYDEGGRPGTRSNSRNKPSPQSLDIPPLNSSFDEYYGDRRLADGHNRPPPRHGHTMSSRASPRATQTTANTKANSPSIEGRRQRQEVVNIRTRSLSRERIQGGSPEPHGRPPSPLIQERVREFSQESRGRNPSRTGSASGTSSRSYSHEPSPPTTWEASVERFTSEYRREMIPQTNSSASSSVPTTPVILPNRSERAPQEKIVRRITAIREAPTKRSSSFERRPPTPINQSTSMDAPSHTSQQESNSSIGGGRSQQHADVAAYWQEKARSSPTFPMPEYPVALMNQSSDSPIILHSSEKEGQTRSTETGSSLSDQQISDLVAKLSAVNRANPAEALAQIDSILRQESRSNSLDPDHGVRGGLGESGQRESPNHFVDGETASMIDDDSDNDTSVSSMTNPTFQSSSNPSHDQSRGLVPQNQLSATDLHGRPPNSFPSTSSFRRPRPSALQSYIPATLHRDPSTTHKHEEGTSMSKAKERREQLRQHPPPLTIKVRDSQETAPSLRRSENEDRFKITVAEEGNTQWQPPPSPSPTFKDDRVNVTVTQQDREIAAHPSKPDDIFPDMKTLEAQLGVWGDTRHVKKKGDSERRTPASRDPRYTKKDDPPAQHRTTLPAPTKRNRPHPWDDEIPTRTEKIDTRETSMENAAGVEAAVPPRKAMNIDDRHLRSPDVSLADKDHSRVKTKPKIMTELRQKSLIEVFPDDPAIFFDAPPQDRQRGGRSSELLQKNEQAPNSFDAWTSMQEGNYFRKTPLIPDPQPISQDAQRDSWLSPPQQDTAQKRDPRRGGPVDLDQSVDTFASSIHETMGTRPPASSIHETMGTRPPASSIHDTMGIRRPASSIHDTLGTRLPASSIHETMGTRLPAHLDNTERSKSQLERGSIEVSWVSEEDDSDFVDTSGESSNHLQVPQSQHCIPQPNKTKRRGFLRAFARREKMDKPPMPKQGAPPSMPMSRAGTGFLPPVNSRTAPQIRLQPLSPAFYPEPIADRGRGRTGPPQRSRPASGEHKPPMPKQGAPPSMPMSSAGTGSLPPSNSRTAPQVRLQPLSPAFYPEPIADQGRGRADMRYGGPPQRSRSASGERFRSSNMARKFGRVLRLYDQD